MTATVVVVVVLVAVFLGRVAEQATFPFVQPEEVAFEFDDGWASFEPLVLSPQDYTVERPLPLADVDYGRHPSSSVARGAHGNL